MECIPQVIRLAAKNTAQQAIVLPYKRESRSLYHLPNSCYLAQVFFILTLKTKEEFMAVPRESSIALASFLKQIEFFGHTMSFQVKHLLKVHLACGVKKKRQDD